MKRKISCFAVLGLLPLMCLASCSSQKAITKEEAIETLGDIIEANKDSKYTDIEKITLDVETHNANSNGETINDRHSYSLLDHFYSYKETYSGGYSNYWIYVKNGIYYEAKTYDKGDGSGEYKWYAELTGKEDAVIKKWKDETKEKKEGIMPPSQCASYYLDSLTSGELDKEGYTYSFASSGKGNVKAEFERNASGYLYIKKERFQFDNYYLTELYGYSNVDGFEKSYLDNWRANVCELSYPSFDETWFKSNGHTIN